MKRVILLLSLICNFAAIAQADTLKLATVNWAPYYSASLPENGFFSALSVEAFKRAGYKTELHFVPWKRALEGSKVGQYDGLLGAYYNEDRAQYFAYTDVIYRAEEIFISVKGRKISYQKLEDLRFYIIGGLAAGAPLRELTAQGFSTQPTTTELSSLRKLAIGRIDLMVMGKAQFYYAMQHEPELAEYADVFSVLAPPFKQYDLFCPITLKRPDAKEIVSKFNTALAKMKQDGSYIAILDRFNQQ